MWLRRGATRSPLGIAYMVGSTAMFAGGNAVVSNYLSPVWAMILGFAVWGDVPTPGLLLGSAIVVASGVYILWRQTVHRRRPAIPAPQRG
jgi:drug/metabolite transporter (DMT)-like permease